MANDTPDDMLKSVGDPELPYAVEVWGGFVDNLDQWWESLVECV
jgi:hypothetical protein